MLRDPAHPPLFAALLRHYDELVDHIRRRFGDPHLARDVLQDVCVQLLERPPAGQVTKPLAFLRHVSTHRAIDRHRAESTRQTHTDAWHADMGGMGDIGASPDVADAIAHRQTVDRLERSIAALPPRCQEVFILHRLHDLPQQEVAVRLGISRGMVARHLARALTLLAPELAALGEPSAATTGPRETSS
ncbi:RNA polymerase sigma factor [Cupriavidus plantarum]|uniref:RNA polymerase sigma factor n=1 Tax=Cupriavidus plantarum TaxID=942865 RepID=UPI000F2D21FA|nr:RNA polymerase sigma factor [Cupriavidus plantarum]NYI02041.1 RNA polymerase sigma-70 factor (ECF subfamily) [Cupriavidus plantarum]RLK31701.1 RNA polymerase sigma-70 factor (ECF subfamily) [Cupriavidus plantarum]